MFTTPGSRAGRKNPNRLSRGFFTGSVSLGTMGAGAVLTPDPAKGNIQDYVAGGAHTIKAPLVPCTMIIEVTNASAGALTTSDFSIVSGDTYSSTGTKKHIFKITKTKTYSELNVAYVTGT